MKICLIICSDNFFLFYTIFFNGYNIVTTQSRKSAQLSLNIEMNKSDYASLIEQIIFHMDKLLWLTYTGVWNVNDGLFA